MTTLSVTLLQDIFIDGTKRTAGTVVTISKELAAELVTRKIINKSDYPMEADPVARFATNANDDITGLVGSDGELKRANNKSGSPHGIIRTFKSSSLNTAITVASTIDTEQAALAPFTGVKLIFANYDNVNILPITKFKVTASPFHGYGVAGPNGNNASHNWIQGYFNGVANVDIPVATLSAAGSTNQNIPSIVTSDLIKVSSIPRTDSYSGSLWTKPLLRTRTLITPVGQVQLVTGNAFPEWSDPVNSAYTYDLVNAMSKTAGDIVTNTADTNSVYDLYGGDCLPSAYQFYYAGLNVNVACCGDSLTQGVGSTILNFGYPQQAMSKLQSKVSNLNGNFMNFGVSGQQHRDSMSIAKKVITSLKPDYICIFAQSPNGSGNGVSTQSAMDRQWIDTLDVIELCKQNNVTPVVITSPVFGGANLPLLQAMNARVKAIAGYVLVVDAYEALSPSGTLTNHTDGTHLTTTGYGIIAGLVTDTIARDFI